MISKEGQQFLSAAAFIIAAQLKDSEILITCVDSARVACDHAEEQEIEVGHLRKFLGVAEAIAPFVTGVRSYKTVTTLSYSGWPTYTDFECKCISDEAADIAMEYWHNEAHGVPDNQMLIALSITPDMCDGALQLDGTLFLPG